MATPKTPKPSEKDTKDDGSVSLIGSKTVTLPTGTVVTNS